MSFSSRLLKTVANPWFFFIYWGFICFCFFYVDRPLAEYLQAFEFKANYVWLSWLTGLGSKVIYVPVFCLLVLFFRYIRPNQFWENHAWFWLICVFIPEVLCIILKIVLGRARPSLWFEQQVYGFYGFQLDWHFWSFPSGHTTTIVAVALSLGMVFSRYLYPLMTLALLVALTRVLLLNHYLSDVLAAFYLTVLEIAVLLPILKRKSWLNSLAYLWQDKK